MKVMQRQYRLSQMAIALFACYMVNATGADYFDPSLINYGNVNGQAIDLNAFSAEDYFSPGKYLIDIYVNNIFYVSREVTFEEDDNKKLRPLLSLQDLDEMGVSLSSLPSLPDVRSDKVLDIRNLSLIPSATFVFDTEKQRLNINIPQLYLKRNIDYAASRKKWEQGVTAAFVNYNLSGNEGCSNYSSSKVRQSSNFLSLNTGMNVGAWRLRSNMNWARSQVDTDRNDTFEHAVTHQSIRRNQWNFLDRYVQRDIHSLNGELTLGDTHTSSVTEQLIDGFSFRGATLASNEYMLPATMRGFAPVISGVAKSNAQVTVTQNGYVIYQTYVAAGPFKIDDLAGGSSSGDIYVSIKEADGTVHGFQQAYSSLPEMQREGTFKYDLSVGRYGNSGYATQDKKPIFYNASLIYGLPFSVTGMGNVLYSPVYKSVSAGIALSLGTAGTLATSVSSSDARTENGQSLKGHAFNARYSKSMTSTGTTFQLASYRYSTKNFMSFSEANTEGYTDDSYLNYLLSGKRKSTWSGMLSQSIGGRYSAYFIGRKDYYWDRKTVTTLSAGIGGALLGSSWTINYDIDRVRGNGSWPQNKSVSLNLSVPFSAFSSSTLMDSVRANYHTGHTSQGRTSNMLGISGNALEDNKLSWNVTQNWENNSHNNSRAQNQSVAIGYDGQYARINGGFNHTQDSDSYNYGMSGSLLVHSRGVLFSQQSVGNAAVLVHVPDVAGAKVMNGRNISTNKRGYALIPYASVYEKNNITVDPGSLPDGTDVEDTSASVYPTKGAIVAAEYKVHSGHEALINLSYGGKPVPLGALATVDERVFIVGNAGQAYVSGIPERGNIMVNWGGGNKYQCSAEFSLGQDIQSEHDGKWHPLKEINLNCK